MLRSWLLAIALGSLSRALPATAAEPSPSLPGGGDVAVMAARIDELLRERCRADEIPLADLADDSEFLRRAALDLTGMIPREAEVRAFLQNDHPDKRAQAIDRLLAAPTHATHLANTWRNIMLPGNLDPEQRENVVGVQTWLRTQFVNEMRYDRIVSDLIVATGGGERGPALYFTSLELKPEKLAASTARIFLGLQIECAECHNHPFDQWTQEDFWGYAAFFARLLPGESGQPQEVNLIDIDVGEVKLPGTETVIAPKFPGGRQPEATDGGTRRVQLAIWMAGRDNPYLARAAVNRVWAQLFGRGLVEPLDDLGPHNPPSHPELLHELTEYFVQSGYDLQQLYRTLANTQAYQRTSAFEGTPPAAHYFASMPVKTLTAEQLYDSLRQFGPAGPALPGAGVPVNPVADARRVEFLTRLQSQSRSAVEYDWGVPQALTLMNGTEVGTLTDAGQSAFLRSLEAPWLTDAERVETLFLGVLGRLPREPEQIQFGEYLQQRSERRSEAFADMFWALLNSAEFTFNH